MKCTSLKLLEENIRENLHNLRLSRVLDMTPKPVHKRKISKLDCMNFIKFCSENDPAKRIKG